MTYYELVKYLRDLINSPIEYKNVEFLNSIKITLEGERYQRFLVQMEITVYDRLTNMVNRLKDKIVTEYLDVNNLTIETSLLHNEVNYCIKLCRCLLIKPENQEEFVSSIIDTNNKLIDTLITFFDDEERQLIVKRLYLKEENL